MNLQLTMWALSKDSRPHFSIPYLINPTNADPALAPLQAADCTSRIALGPRKGQKVLTWKDPALRLASQETPNPKGCVSKKKIGSGRRK